MGLLSWTTGQVLGYSQSVALKTKDFTYKYKVRIKGDVYFPTNRKVTYWEVGIVGTTETVLEQKSLEGYSSNNVEMLNVGIHNYLSKRPILTYQTHVQNLGWQQIQSEWDMSGTSGKSLRLEGIKIYLNSNGHTGTVQYRTHVQNLGWQSWVSNGQMSGTSGKSLRLEAIQIKFTGALADKYDIYYRVHVQDLGWQEWKYNGETAGTTGKNKRLEAIEITLRNG